MKGQFLNLARQLMNLSVCFFDVLATAEAFYRDNKNKIVNYHNACVGVRDSDKVILILWFVYKIWSAFSRLGDNHDPHPIHELIDVSDVETVNQSFKSIYLKELTREAIKASDAGLDINQFISSMEIDTAIELVHSSWQELPETTIARCLIRQKRIWWTSPRWPRRR